MVGTVDVSSVVNSSLQIPLQLKLYFNQSQLKHFFFSKHLFNLVVEYLTTTTHHALNASFLIHYNKSKICCYFSEISRKCIRYIYIYRKRKVFLLVESSRLSVRYANTIVDEWSIHYITSCNGRGKYFTIAGDTGVCVCEIAWVNCVTVWCNCGETEILECRGYLDRFWRDCQIPSRVEASKICGVSLFAVINNVSCYGFQSPTRRVSITLPPLSLVAGVNVPGENGVFTEENICIIIFAGIYYIWYFLYESQDGEYKSFVS